MNCGFLGISEFDCVGKASCKVTLTLFSGSTAFPYCKWWKAGQSLVTNLKLVIYALILHTIWISYLPFRAVAMTLKLLLPATMALTLTWIFTSLDMDMVTWEIFATCMVAKVSVSCGITPPNSRTVMHTQWCSEVASEALVRPDSHWTVKATISQNVQTCWICNIHTYIYLFVGFNSPRKLLCTYEFLCIVMSLCCTWMGRTGGSI